MILNEYVAGVGSVSPPAVARTAKVCLPGFSLNVTPDVQGLNALPSMLQANVDPATVEVNPKLTETLRFVVLIVFFGT